MMKYSYSLYFSKIIKSSNIEALFNDTLSIYEDYINVICAVKKTSKKTEKLYRTKSFLNGIDFNEVEYIQLVHSREKVRSFRDPQSYCILDRSNQLLDILHFYSSVHSCDDMRSMMKLVLLRYLRYVSFYATAANVANGQHAIYQSLGIASPGMDKDEIKTNSEWLYDLKHNGSVLSGKIRNVYSVNWINKLHANFLLRNGLTLYEWINQSNRLGEILALDSGIYKWTVAQEKSHYVRQEIKKLGILFNE